MSTALFPRRDLLASLRQAVDATAPTLLTGPPGAGKTTLLLELARLLEGQGFSVVYLDLMGAASSPDRFVAAALGALTAERFGDRVREATDLRRRVAAGRDHHAEAVRALFGFWASLDRAGGRPVALLLDEVTEIRSLAYFPGLRQVESQLAAALRARKRATFVATSYPTMAQGHFGADALAVPPLGVAEIASAEAGPIVQATFGWARYVRLLLDALGNGASSVAEAWLTEMSHGGRLETACHHTYETLLLRSRGYGICKAALDAVARDEGANLKALVQTLGRTPGATRDYLQWLVGVDALRMDKKRYRYVDGLLAVWVRLHARGIPASAKDVREALDRLLVQPANAGPATDATIEPSAPEAPPRRPRHDTLMEID